jgi:APA family basic amino acid/polyamine antiporter
MIGPWSGFFAGWSFVIGKTASCAAMALTFAVCRPRGWEKPVAVAAVLVLAAVNTVGVTRTAALTKVIVVVVLAVLALVVVAASASGAGSADNLVIDPGPHGWYGVLQSAGLLFFAFAGYARIATMGEEGAILAGRSPRDRHRAELALIVYVAIARVALATLGPERLAASSAPLAEVAAAGGWTWTAPVAGRGGGGILGLFWLVAGIGRTSLAMARTGDLPQWLGGAPALRRSAPRGARARRRRESSIVATDLRSAIGSRRSACCCTTWSPTSRVPQDAAARRFPRALQIVGMIGWRAGGDLPWPSIVGGGGRVRRRRLPGRRGGRQCRRQLDTAAHR